MYRSEKFNPTLSGKLFHPGGKPAEVLPWEKPDEAYGRYFTAGYGHPAKDARLAYGLQFGVNE